MIGSSEKIRCDALHLESVCNGEGWWTTVPQEELVDHVGRTLKARYVMQALEKAPSRATIPAPINALAAQHLMDLQLHTISHCDLSQL